MIQVSENKYSKLSEDLQRTPEKSVPPKVDQKMKTLPEKTKFTLQYNTVNNQRVKNVDKKDMKSITPEASKVLRGTKGSLAIPGGQYIQVNCTRDKKLTERVSKCSQLNNDRKISSIPFLTPASDRKTSATSAIRSTKASIATKIPEDSKSGLRPPKRSCGLHVQTSSSLNSKTEGKTVSGIAENSKKSMVFPSGVKLKESPKTNKTKIPNIKTTISGHKPSESRLIQTETKQTQYKTRLFSTPVRGRRNYGLEEGRMMTKIRSRSQEVKRITSKENLLKLGESAQRKRSEGKILFNDLDRKILISRLAEAMKRDWESGSMTLDPQNKALLDVASRNPSKGYIEENLTPGDADAQNDHKNSKIKSNWSDINDFNSTNEDKISHYYPSNLNEGYDALETLERSHCDEELLNLDKRAWSNLEIQIKETCEKTDFLYDSGDDSVESMSDIIQQVFSNQEEEDLIQGFKKSQSRKHSEHREEWNSPQLEKKLKEVRKCLPKKELVKDFCDKSKTMKEKKETDTKRNQGSKRTKSNEDSKIRNNKHEFRTKSLSGDIKWADSIKESSGKLSKEWKTVNFRENDLLGNKYNSSNFFHNHQNIGFIGKEMDEEFVSFEPGQVTLYQPHESQMLLYDIANCTATQGYLRMCDMTFNVTVRKNAEQMSPSGRVPFISSSLCIIPEFEAIVSFMQYKKFSCISIKESDKPVFRAIISMIANVLENAERYICWYDDTTLFNYTRPRIGGQYPFPLNHIMHWKKRYEERCRLRERGYLGRSLEMILDEINSCFRSLSRSLGNNTFFFGRVGTEVDALVYGHIYALFTTEVDGPLRDLQVIVQQYPNLVSFARNFDRMFSLNNFSNIKQSYWDNIATDDGYPRSTSLTVKV